MTRKQQRNPGHVRDPQQPETMERATARYVMQVARRVLCESEPASALDDAVAAWHEHRARAHAARAHGEVA